MLVKPGVRIEGAHPWVLYAAQVYDWLHQAAGFGEGTITGGLEPAPGRTANTLHPSGRAVDLRSRTVPPDLRFVFADYLRYYLGPAFQVIVEADHFHVELSPRALAYLESGGLA